MIDNPTSIFFNLFGSAKTNYTYNTENTGFSFFFLLVLIFRHRALVQKDYVVNTKYLPAKVPPRCYNALILTKNLFNNNILELILYKRNCSFYRRHTCSEVVVESVSDRIRRIGYIIIAKIEREIGR